MSVTFSLSTEPTIVRGQCESCNGTGWDYNAPQPEGPFDPIPEECQCWECRGSGVVNDRVYPVEPVNLSNHNAAIVLEALGLQIVEYGSIPADQVHTVIRMGIRANNTPGTFEALAEPGYVVPAGSAGVQIIEEDGVLVVRHMGPRIVSAGMSAEGIAWRAGRVLGLFHAAARLGCGVHWG
jgi:hypothetical protein